MDHRELKDAKHVFEHTDNYDPERWGRTFAVLDRKVWRLLPNGVDIATQGTNEAAAAEILRLARDNARLRANEREHEGTLGIVRTMCQERVEKVLAEANAELRRLNEENARLLAENQQLSLQHVKPPEPRDRREGW